VSVCGACHLRLTCACVLRSAMVVTGPHGYPYTRPAHQSAQTVAAEVLYRLIMMRGSLPQSPDNMSSLSSEAAPLHAGTCLTPLRLCRRCDTPRACWLESDKMPVLELEAWLNLMASVGNVEDIDALLNEWDTMLSTPECKRSKDPHITAGCGHFNTSVRPHQIAQLRKQRAQATRSDAAGATGTSQIPDPLQTMAATQAPLHRRRSTLVGDSCRSRAG
jgi:hypothetical protein